MYNWRRNSISGCTCQTRSGRGISTGGTQTTNITAKSYLGFSTIFRVFCRSSRMRPFKRWVRVPRCALWYALILGKYADRIIVVYLQYVLIEGRFLVRLRSGILHRWLSIFGVRTEVFSWEKIFFAWSIFMVGATSAHLVYLTPSSSFDLASFSEASTQKSSLLSPEDLHSFGPLDIADIQVVAEVYHFVSYTFVHMEKIVTIFMK